MVTVRLYNRHDPARGQYHQSCYKLRCAGRANLRPCCPYDCSRDSLATRVTYPRGNGWEMVYQRDFDPAANPVERANLRVRRQLPVSGAALVERFEHQPGFGTTEMLRPGKGGFTDYDFE